jgi:hypothetical protein
MILQAIYRPAGLTYAKISGMTEGCHVQKNYMPYHNDHDACRLLDKRRRPDVCFHMAAGNGVNARR